MVLITSLFFAELHFFFINFREREREQLTLSLSDLEVKKCAHAQSKSFPICFIKHKTNKQKTNKTFSFCFNRNENPR